MAVRNDIEAFSLALTADDGIVGYRYLPCPNDSVYHQPFITMSLWQMFRSGYVRFRVEETNRIKNGR